MTSCPVQVDIRSTFYPFLMLFLHACTQSYKLYFTVLEGLLALLFKIVGLFIVTLRFNAFAVFRRLTE